MSHDFRIKPLSEGLGLGSLRTPAARPQHQELPTIEIQTLERAHHQVYRKQAVSSTLRQAPKARTGVFFARAIAGWGLDAIMVCLTLVMCSVLGIMSWRFGSGATANLDPIDTLKIMANFISLHGLRVIGLAVAATWLVYWSVMKALVGATLGSVLTRG